MSEEDRDFGLVCPFWIDTGAYSDRDREMFVCGYEFAELLRHIRHDAGELKTTVHRENESRIRLACARFGRTCTTAICEQEHDPEGTWSYLTIEAKP